MKEIYWYKNKAYSILSKSKIKIDNEWKSCIIYQCEYDNPDGKIWVRLEEEFFDKFKKIE